MNKKKSNNVKNVVIKKIEEVKKFFPEKIKIGVVGGSGVYNIEEIKNITLVDVKTPFGVPSDKIVVGTLSGKLVAFLPRHGKGHKIMPTEVNSWANIYALKMLGVKVLVSISACGSLREEIQPRDFVLPDQIFDRTRLRQNTFFGKGVVCHISFDEPYCYNLRKLIYDCCKELNIRTHFGGTYVCIEGPQFSTKAESRVNQQLGFDIVGMTALPEAKLAREAEICYVTVAQVTDYDVWKEGEEVSLSQVISNLNANVENSKRLLKLVVEKLDINNYICKCNEALKNAIITRKEFIPLQTRKKLSLLIDKYLR